jgi:hypothetical protein
VEDTNSPRIGRHFRLRGSQKSKEICPRTAAVSLRGAGGGAGATLPGIAYSFASHVTNPFSLPVVLGFGYNGVPYLPHVIHKIQGLSGSAEQAVKERRVS